MDKTNENQLKSTASYEEKALNCQINYIIIDKLWHHLKKKPKDLFFELDITANKYSKIRTGECPLEYLKNKWNEQNSPLQKIGLPEEIMLGNSVIEIKGILKKEWEEYLLIRYVENKGNKDNSDNKNRKNDMRNFDIKLKKAFRQLEDEKKIQSNIGKLYYFMKYGVAFDSVSNDREMKELQEALKKIHIKHIKNCESKLRKEIESQMKKLLYQIDIIIAYDGLE